MTSTRRSQGLNRKQLQQQCSRLRKTTKEQQKTIESQASRIKEQDRAISELEGKVDHLQSALWCRQEEVEELEDGYECQLESIYSDMDDLRKLAIENAEAPRGHDSCLPPQYDSLGESTTPCNCIDVGTFNFEKFERATLDNLHPRTEISETSQRLSETIVQIRYLLHRANSKPLESMDKERKRDHDNGCWTCRLIDLIFDVILCLIARYDPLLAKNLPKRKSKAIFWCNIQAHIARGAYAGRTW